MPTGIYKRSKAQIEQLQELAKGPRSSRNGGYGAIHKWLRRHYGNANKCESSTCNDKSNIYQWALRKGKKHEYERDNYIMLCASCHAKYDMETIPINILVPYDIYVTAEKVQRETLFFPLQNILSQMVSDGFVLMQETYNEKIKHIDSLRAPLEFAKLDAIRNILGRTRIIIDELGGVHYQAFAIPIFISTTLTNWSHILLTHRASLIRLCMYHSVATITDIPEIVANVLPVAHEEITKFDVHLSNMNALYEGLTLAESIVRNNTQEHTQAEVKSYPIQEERLIIAEPDAEYKVHKNEGT